MKKTRSPRVMSSIESNSPEFDLFFDIEERLEEEATELMTETMEQYMSKTHGDYGSGVTRPKINTDTHFELKGKFLKELRDNTFSGSEHEDANEHIEKVLEIVDLFHIPHITKDQIMLRAFPFLSKYCPPARTTKKIEEINNFQQKPDEILFLAWERFKELLIKCPQHYLTDMQSGTSTKTRSTKTSEGLAAIQAQLNNLGRIIKKVNEKVYAAQVGCELCKGPHYTKDCPLKEDRKTLEEAYYTQFGAPYQPGGQYRAVGPGFYQQNNRNSSYPKFMVKSAKRHKENSNIIKEIRSSTDATIKNQGASIKTLEIQIGQMSKVLQERGFGSLPSSTETNPMDHVKSILIAKADSTRIRRIGSGPYAVSDSQFSNVFSETIPFPRRLHDYYYDEWNESRKVKILETYSNGTTLHDNTLP
ncbi:hypothetical protein Tco_1347766 [Tanacetum coccineum]